MNDQTRFEDFLFSKWKTAEIEYQKNGDTLYYKGFSRSGKTYAITARFSYSGDYIKGYLADEDGYALVNGNGFSCDSFITFLQRAFNVI
jgi:hypothetical protein